MIRVPIIGNPEFNASLISLLPMKGVLAGLNTGFSGTNLVVIQSGGCVSSDETEILKLPSVISKNLDLAWAAGSGSGGLDTGVVGNNSYHVFLIKNLTTNVVDALFSLSPTTPTMPSGYTKKRRIASIIRSGGAILEYFQFGDDFWWASPSAHAIVGVLANASFAITVPSGIEVIAKGIVSAGRSSGSDGDKAIAITTPGFNNFNAVGAPDINTFRGHCGGQHAASSFSADLKGTASYFEVMTDSSAQIEVDVTGTSAADGVVQIVGWRDFRGREI